MSSLQLPNPKNVLSRFELQTVADICWVIGSFFALLLLLCSFIIFTIILLHLFYVKDAQNKKVFIEQSIVKYLSILCCVFGLICSIAGFSTFPVCTTYECGYNTLGNMYFIINLNSYILSKLFLYILFIKRLFNEYSQKVYDYSAWVQKFLEMLILVMFATIILSTVFAIIIDYYENDDKVDGLDLSAIIAVVIYVLADIILSGITLILFFVPLWKFRIKSSTASKFDIIKKYVAISLSQTAMSMIYGISLTVRFVSGWYHTSSNEGVSYLDICTVIQLSDIMVTILCIYYGFVKKNTDTSCCDICKDCCGHNCNTIKYICCTSNKKYIVLWDDNLLNKPINQDESDSNLEVFYKSEHVTLQYEDDTKSPGCTDSQKTSTSPFCLSAKSSDLQSDYIL